MIGYAAPPAGTAGAAQPVGVAARHVALPWLPPLAGYLALAERYGADQLCLLESAGGPATDRRAAYLGFGPLMRVTVTGCEVELTGPAGPVAVLRDRLADLLAPTGPAGPAGPAGQAGPAGPAGAVSRARLRERTALWEVLRRTHAAFAAPASAREFAFGFLAFFGYDAAHAIEDLPTLIPPSGGPAVPDAGLVLYGGWVRFDLARRAVRATGYSSRAWPEPPLAEVADLLRRAARGPVPARAPAGVPAGAAGWSATDSTTATRFTADVERCLRHVAVGDVYQVQIGHELTVRCAAPPLSVYLRLRARDPAPYLCLAGYAGRTVVAASPELFVRIEERPGPGGPRRVVTMRPIAGTAPYPPGTTSPGAAPATGLDTVRAAGGLRGDPKEIAEHVMLVDLCRNDIGRICRPATLTVPGMLAVERYARVLHLVSTVEGEQAPGLDCYDVIAALFPAGTMTGAPKIRAMEIIESVETRRRGLYAGAFGLVGSGGYVNLALCIRTLVHHGDRYTIRASAGVVADSRPDREWRETLAKMSAAHWAVTGRELW